MIPEQVTTPVGDLIQSVSKFFDEQLSGLNPFYIVLVTLFFNFVFSYSFGKLTKIYAFLTNPRKVKTALFRIACYIPQV
jgi:hypothetical protein